MKTIKNKKLNIKTIKNKKLNIKTIEEKKAILKTTKEFYISECMNDKIYCKLWNTFIKYDDEVNDMFRNWLYNQKEEIINDLNDKYIKILWNNLKEDK